MQSKQNNKNLIIVAGPTAVGKTALCISLAKEFDCPILSADSRQFYRETEIATAKPTVSELNQVKHYFINTLSIFDEYTVADYEKEALQLLETLFEKHNTLLLTGGSGLFLKAITDGLDEMPSVDNYYRERLNKEFNTNGLTPLLAELKERDPVYYQKVDRNNHIRIIRALEIIRATEKPFSSFQNKNKQERPFRMIKILLNRDRQELYSRIDLRMDQMIEEGLFREAKALYAYKHLNALQTVGYTEIFKHYDGDYDYNEAVRLLKRNSRRYAKRQLTWFRKDKEYVEFHPDNYAEIIDYIKKEKAD